MFQQEFSERDTTRARFVATSEKHEVNGVKPMSRSWKRSAKTALNLDLTSFLECTDADRW